MSPSETPSRRLPLDALHQELGAKMIDFSGWQMPVQYPDGLKAEHLHVRTHAGLFDVSHMGQLRVTARDNKESTLHRQLEAALPVDFQGWPKGLQRYTLLLNEQGGIEDDLMLANLEDCVVMVVNAGNREADYALLTNRCPDLIFEWIDAALIALQGPRAADVLSMFDQHSESLRFMRTGFLNLEDAYCFTARAGYTGEDGFEISVPTMAAERVVRQLLRHPSVKPVGLGARDSLRLEAGLPLHGHDITSNTTPQEAGLTFAIARSRRIGGDKAGGFPGTKKIAEQSIAGVRRRLTGLSSSEAIPIRAGTVIIDHRGEQVGEVTSGTVSPSLNRPIMLAYLDQQVLDQENPVALRAKVRTKTPAVAITGLPFVEKRYKR